MSFHTSILFILMFTVTAPDTTNCPICFQSPIVSIVLPCNIPHEPICFSCISRIFEGEEGRCPFCRNTYPSLSFEEVQTTVHEIPEEVELLRLDHEFPVLCHMAAMHQIQTSLAMGCSTAGFGILIPLFQAIGQGHLEVIDILLSHRADINQRKRGSLPLYEASAGGQDEIVEKLVSFRANVNDLHAEFRTSALLIASQEGHRSVVKFLLQQLADANIRAIGGENAIDQAVRKGHLEITTYLCNQTSDLSSAFCRSVALGRIEFVKCLADAMADISQGTTEFTPPIHQAAAGGHGDILRFLLDSNASANQISPLNGASPLFLGAQEGHQEVVGILVGSKSDVNYRSHSGVSVVFVAAWNNHKSILKLVAKHGSVAEAIEFARDHQQEETERLLLELM